MDDKNLDIFQVSKANPFENNKKEDNFFLQGNVPEHKILSEPTRRLNDYDFNLLQEDAYKDVSDDLFKLEYKISKIEDELKIINSQIISANEIQDNMLITDLENRKQLLIEEHDELVILYNNKSLSAKISDSISSVFTNKVRTGFQGAQKHFSILRDKFQSKLPKKLVSALELKKSLNKLENINKSVDELISLNTPYGEDINKYEQLSKYIIKANAIQNEISKYIK